LMATIFSTEPFRLIHLYTTISLLHSMLAACAELKNAEKVKQFLVKHNLWNRDYLPMKALNEMFFPLNKAAKVPSARVKRVKLNFELRPDKITIKSLLAKKLTEKQVALLPKSQEIIGSILVLEIPPGLEKKEKLIAEAYLKLLPRIETVVKKAKIHSGEYRTRTVKVLAGKKTKETIHRESGVQLKLHLEKAYFSPKSANERLRIARQVKPGEEVLVLFSGIAPFPLVLAKNSSASKIYGIEMNPLAHGYAVANVHLNKAQNVVIHRGDVRLVLPKWRSKFDRIVLPLPKASEQFLEVVLPKAKKGSMIHLYSFLNEKDLSSSARKIKTLCKQEGREVRVLRTVKCGSFSPGIFRVCFDIKVS